MIQQQVEGLRPRSININGSDEDLAEFAKLLAGKIVVYKLIESGGEPLAHNLSGFNKKSYVISKRNEDGSRVSTMFNVPHMKQGAGLSEVEQVVVGAFDCGYEDNMHVKCDKILLKFSGEYKG